MTTHDPVPFLDLVTPHEFIRNRLMHVLSEAISTGHFVGGAAVEKFESEFAGFCGTNYCVGLSSGTDALRFALMTSIPKESIVITVPNSFIATTEAITQANAIPYFVDVDEQTLNMDPKGLSAFLSKHCYIDKRKAWAGGQEGQGGQTIHKSTGRIVSAIVPVHLYGQCADMDSLQTLADEYHLMVIEDACQAHGASYFSEKKNKWCRAGTMSTCAAFSFYPGKNLGALGEGGAVTTDDPFIAEQIRMLREHGSSKKYYHPMEGYNARLDALQAGFLSEKLPYLQSSNTQRRRCAEYYNQALANLPGIATPIESKHFHGNYHLYVIKASHRDELQKYLTAQGIGSGLHYPLPLHLQEAYKHLNYKVHDFPVTESAAEKILSLPMFPALTVQQQDHVIEAIKSFYETHDYIESDSVENSLHVVSK